MTRTGVCAFVGLCSVAVLHALIWAWGVALTAPPLDTLLWVVATQVSFDLTMLVCACILAWESYTASAVLKRSLESERRFSNRIISIYSDAVTRAEKGEK